MRAAPIAEGISLAPTPEGLYTYDWAGAQTSSLAPGHNRTINSPRLIPHPRVVALCIGIGTPPAANTGAPSIPAATIASSSAKYRSPVVHPCHVRGHPAPAGGNHTP